MKIFDSHFHIINPSFKIEENQGFLPDPYTVEDYLEETSSLDLVGGAVVSGSFQGYDQSYLKEALKKLGKGFVGVTQLPVSAEDSLILELNAYGVRGVRFNCKRGGSEDIRYIEEFAQRIYELVQWHVELYIESKELSSWVDILAKLPKVSLAHLGLTKEGFENLLYLAQQGVKIKACGFSRVDFSVKEALIKIHEINPSALMFGTDLPSTRAPRRFSKSDLNLLDETFEKEDLQKILFLNASEFYT